VIEEEIYRKRQLHFFYLGAASRMNPHRYHALRFDLYTHRNGLYITACSPWEGDNISFSKLI